MAKIGIADPSTPIVCLCVLILALCALIFRLFDPVAELCVSIAEDFVSFQTRTHLIAEDLPPFSEVEHPLQPILS